MAEAIALIDYGAGNLHSVHNALIAAGAERVAVTADPALVRGARRVVLPGVGSFKACADGLHAIPGLVEALEERVIGRGVPFLGVCVGMQLLATRGLEHGATPGLGWIEGEVRLIERADRDIAAMTDHGGGLVAAVARDNVMGVQFHPEKSQAYGLALLARFLEWNP